MKQIQAPQLAAWLADQSKTPPLLLDVREPWEVDMCSLEGITHIPMHTVPLRCEELDAQRDVVVICHHGGRSMQVAMFLERKGFSSVYNLAGGMDGWACNVNPDMRRY
jgi:rhodanese-related sulfurtransferase